MRHKQRFYPAPGYVSQIYGYGRVSHTSQFEAGNSIADQEARIKAYVEMRKMEPEGPLTGAEWAGMHSEPRAQSAFKRPFRMRPTGKELIGLLQPSDHLVIDKLDRLTRDVADFLDFERYLSERGIRLHIVNMAGASLDAGSSFGRFMLVNFALHAEFESIIKSERVRDARARARAQKRHAGTRPPFFMKCVDCAAGKTRGGRLVFEDWYQPIIERVLFMRDVLKMSWKDICLTLRRERRGLPQGTPFAFNPRQLDAMYWFYKAWKHAGEIDINEIKVKEFIDNYKREHRNGETDV